MATPHTPGRFVWRELWTPDVQVVQPWYASVFGWTFQAVPMDEFTYYIAMVGDVQVAGMCDSPAPSPAVWVSYVSVPDVDAALELAEALGAETFLQPTDVPNVGRVTSFKDPTEAVIAAMTSEDGDGPEGVAPPFGAFCWEQLSTPDPDVSAGFYQRVFGWESAEAGLPDVSTFVREGGLPAATAVLGPDGTPGHWLAFIATDDLARTRLRAATGGGEVVVPSVAAPGLGTFAVLKDPAGVLVCAFQAGIEG